MKPRIIVCGLGRTGYKIFKLLGQQGADVVGISDRPMPGERKDDIIIGNLRSATTLIAAGIREAQSIVLANNDDGLNLAILTQARVLNPRIRIINRLFNETLGDRLDTTLRDHVSMSAPALAAPTFAFAALGNKAIGQLQLFDRTWPIHEEIVDENHPWLYRPLSALWDNRSRMLIYYLPATGEFDLITAMEEGKQLQVGDRLIIGTQPKTRSNRRLRPRKLLKVLSNFRQFGHYGRSVTLVSIALLATIFMATLTYTFVNFHTSLVDAFYFSVGMITGAGGKEEVAENGPEGIKIFTAIMMIVGAGVVGICYALINDFILGSRIRQFWDAARVPSRYHYIVCGLGELGLYVIEQFVEQGYEVVAIESNPSNRLLNAARSLGVPVILEDARLANALKAANIDTADALIAATNIDTINVEISLCARGLRPNLPVIVRNQDPEFSLAVQQVFGFETVLCPNELATPAFAAAALGGKILGNGMTDDLLWVALATLITSEHPFYGKTIREAAKEADFVPLYVNAEGRSVQGWDLLDVQLLTGYTVYLTIPATRLDQLWRTPSPEFILTVTGALSLNE
ncbi:NAD(P)-binding protein [Oscillatoria sp. FACHB-1406]|uniref:potassium channel family protein n=1 Tax=Oscillatoria sp. FACHB-1406 TaxID=2692846 RepID=UPI0016841DCF|nr:NAD(P)-binding protein [Oscillatoria sp. FACHB-1406]MBD2579676.1 NAD-binding protein [Oscillatoria sp. FACHB-1406]